MESIKLNDASPLLTGDSIESDEVDDIHASAPGSPKASLSSSIINLSNTILGAGMLGLPSAFAKCGYIFGMIFLVLGGLASAAGAYFLSETARMLGKPNTSTFYSVAQTTIPRYAWLVDVTIVIKCFGVSCAYATVVGDLMPDAVTHIGSYADGAWQTDRILWISLFMILMMWPLSCLPTLDALRFTSAMAVGFVVYLVLVVNIFAFSSEDPCEGKTGCKGTASAVAVSQKTLSVISIYVFAYTCHQNIYPICNEIENNTRKRMVTVFGSSVSVAFVVYTLVACVGYYTFGDKVKSNILNNYPAENAAVTVSRIATSLLVAFSMPLQMYPLRKSLFQLIYSRKDIGRWKEVVYTTILCFMVYGIAVIVGDLGKVLSVVGASSSTIISYVLPGLVYWQACPEWTVARFFAALMFGCGVILIPFCLTFIFLSV